MRLLLHISLSDNLAPRSELRPGALVKQVDTRACTLSKASSVIESEQNSLAVFRFGQPPVATFLFRSNSPSACVVKALSIFLATPFSNHVRRRSRPFGSTQKGENRPNSLQMQLSPPSSPSSLSPSLPRPLLSYNDCDCVTRRPLAVPLSLDQGGLVPTSTSVAQHSLKSTHRRSSKRCLPFSPRPTPSTPISGSSIRSTPS